MKFSVKAGLALAVSAAFVATSVAPAFAASQVDFSGFYRAQFYTFGNQKIKDSDSKTSDSWFKNRFRLNMDVQATDEVSVHARWQGPNDKKWGHDQGDVTVKYAFGQVKQDWGTIQVGRLNDQDGIGHAGLKTLGWDPTTVDGDEANYRPFDTGDGGDGVNYFNTWDNGFSLSAAYVRQKGEDRNDYNGNDRYFDRFQAEGAYKWDTGGASLAVAFDRDATGESSAKDVSYTPGDTYMPDPNDGTVEIPDVNTKKYTRVDHRFYDSTSVWYINPAFVQSWGAFSTHAEAMFGFGKLNTKENWKGDDKISGQGFYLDFDYNYGPGRVNLAGWWTSGNKAGDTPYGPKGKKMKALPDGMGHGFNPLLVLYVGGGLKTANFAQYNTDPDDIDTNGYYETWRANHWAIDLNGQHAFTDEITARWAIAYAGLTNANATKEYGGYDQDKDLGWELDLGLEAELLDNLHIYSGFGYLFAGNAFDTPDGNGKMKSADDGYAWINSLYFNF